MRVGENNEAGAYTDIEDLVTRNWSKTGPIGNRAEEIEEADRH